MASTRTILHERTRSIAIVAALALGASSFVLAAPALGQSAPERVAYEDVWGPSGSPDRVVMTPTDSPATSQAVTWRTSTDVTTPVAEIVVAERGPGFRNYGGRSGRNEVRRIDGAVAGDVSESLHYPMRFHTAVFEDLDPDTTYLYRVGDGSGHDRTNWSEWFEFTTATAGPSDFSFIFVGDAQNDVKEHVTRVFRQAFRHRPNAEIFLSAGDLVDYGDRDYEWGEWFHSNQLTTGNLNQIATPGNHEYFVDGAANDTLSAYWATQFNYPDNGPDGEGYDDDVVAALSHGNVYYVDYQGVRFVSLDTNAGQRFGGGANAGKREQWYQLQAEWLDEVLEDNPHKWTVLTFHHPIFSVSTGRNNAMQRDIWQPVIEKHDVDLVLQGHDHTYGRGHLESAQRGGSSVHDGTVYAVSVSGPKMYDLSGVVWSDNGAVLANSDQDVQLFQLVDVSRNEIRYESRDATGAFHDGVLIRKTDNGARTVTELRG